jgi:hypothetical protein
MFVVPKGELKIIDPARMDALPPEGRDVGVDHPEYWTRRALDGDVQIVPPDQAAAAKDKADRAEALRNADAVAAQNAPAEAAAKTDTQAPLAPKK